jgi:ion channel
VKVLVAALASVLVGAIVWDAFEAVVLPRRVTRRLRPTRFFYRGTWHVWKGIARWIGPGGRREAYLGFYGPLSLLVLLSLWATSLIVGFAGLHWVAGARVIGTSAGADFTTALYFSGTTFFTLGLGDIAPATAAGRVITVVEAGLGFGFLALVIGYLPTLYQAFSRREVNISLLDARAGSPPNAVELLRRHGEYLDELAALLVDWERWSAELLESHVSYPVLSYYRSQHDHQSWLAALTTILDASAMLIVGVEGSCSRQAELTFAIARHAVVDLSQVLRTPPHPPVPDRLPPSRLHDVRAALRESGLALRDGEAADRRLGELRNLYEPYVNALATYLLLELPAWMISASASDDWRTSAWDRSHPDVARDIFGIR